MTKETTMAKFVSSSSQVKVPAGKAIVKIAKVYMANLYVPYSATGINGLGSKTTFSGQWKGVRQYYLEITEEDMVPGGCPCAL